MAVIDHRFWLGAVLEVWGIANTALYPICQIRVMKAAAHSKALAGTMNVSAANAGTGPGAIVGGVTIALWGTASVVYVAAGIALLALAAVPMIARLQRRAIKCPALPDDHPDIARGLEG